MMSARVISETDVIQVKLNICTFRFRFKVTPNGKMRKKAVHCDATKTY